VSGGADLKRFIRLPYGIYAGDPAWVPPLDSDVSGALDPAHPFHRHAEVACFIAWRDGRPVGRIAAIHNRTHVDFHGENAGFFGLFESADDPAAARSLLESAEAWVKQRGLSIIRGPFNFSTNDELWSPGILIDGFQRAPMLMMAHARPYYQQLVEAAGYVKSKDLLAYWVDAETAGLDRLSKAVDRIRQRAGVTLRPIDMKRLDAEVALIQQVYNSAWERNWGFVPMSSAEIDHMARSLKPVVRPDYCLLIEKDGEVIGFGVALPNYNEVLRHLNGRLFPIGFLKFLFYRRRIGSARVITLGLKPGFRNRGLDAMVILELFRAGVRAGQSRGECSWILEDNWDMRRGLERIGGVADKTYRVYEKSLEP
jgi:hypothetical protein